MTLQNFWAGRGCLIWQPYYSQLGAGTLNPATALRVLGPEPWNVAYVEPSIRPDDGRYGENPNRMQMHYQFQVILKPDPGNPQEIYLQSLEALGIDPACHDIRFVEDNWESPALGAWGLGWEVWLDGQEITQFTYFQQAGGFALDPVSVEITYGLERIAIALQRVSSFRDIQWSPKLTDGDVNLQAEQEHSKYYFEVADVERLRKMYDLFEAEANACLEQRLVLPAHDYVLKCSHTFNVLDSRGAIGVTERQALFGRMRELSRRIAVLYLEQRQRLEYPFLAEQSASDAQPAAGQAASPHQQPINTAKEASPTTFLLEIGTEELPAADLQAAVEQLQAAVPALFSDLRLTHGAMQISGTPRRLVVYVEDLAANQPDLEQVIKGPPADRAYDLLGQPTKAAEGFARSRGVALADLEVREVEGGRYVTAVVKQAGKPAQAALAETLPRLIGTLRFEKPMRWNSTNVAFSRPVRWLMALLSFGETSQVIPFEFAGVSSDRRSRGLRFYRPAEIEVNNIEQYFQFLDEQGIILDALERRSVIQQQVRALAGQVNGEVADDPALLAEVANLVEAPRAISGSFDASHLKLPPEVLISVMKKHQRYFPVAAVGDGASLLPYFLTVRNGDGHGAELVQEGNEHVVRARFADADFFVRHDLREPLEAYQPRLATLIFQTRLGSMLDKTKRIEALVGDLAPLLGLDPDQAADARRAASLCKADLATQMVVEMTSLQGSMGRYYAVRSGEKEAVAQAIYEHYLPRFTGDRLPNTLVGLAVGLADRLDTLVGLFAAGLAPSGNKDPFAQRRAALGLVQCLLGWDLSFDLRLAWQAAAAHLPIPAEPDRMAAVADFVGERLRHSLLEQGERYDVVEAVLSEQSHDPARAAAAVRQLTSWIDRTDWYLILPAYSRCVRITREYREIFAVDPDLFTEAPEVALFEALRAAEAARGSHYSIDELFSAFLPLIEPINLFFETVLVMVDDLPVRKNRLGLLQRISALAAGAADLSKLEGF